MAWLLGLTVALGVVGGLMTLAGFAGGSTILLLSLLPCILSSAAYLLLRKKERFGRGEVWVEDAALNLLGKQRFERFDLEDIAWGATRGDEVDFETANGRRIVLKTSRRRAEALLSATGTNVDQRTVTLPLRGAIGPFVTGLLWFMVLVFPCNYLTISLAMQLSGAALTALLLVAGPLLALLFSAMLTRWMAPKFSIGIDGVSVKRALRRRFIPHEAIEKITHSFSSAGAEHMPSIELRLESESVHLPIIGWSDSDVERVMTRFKHVERAKDEAAQRPAASFARQGLSIEDWKARLRRMLSADPSFRGQRVSPDAASTVLSDPTATLEQRVGAALALREVDHDAAEEPIRFAAAACAEKPVRIALLSTLEDDAATKEALSCLEVSAGERHVDVYED